MDTLVFKELIGNSQAFFKILPQEWQDDIVPFWEDIKSDAKIYTIENQNTIVGGGIVFYKSPPHFEYFETEAKVYFDNGYLYLGFIWIDENHRHQHLGSFWLNQLKAQNSQQLYFLLTEEEHLYHFYIKNGFQQVKPVQNQEVTEWLFVSKH